MTTTEDITRPPAHLAEKIRQIGAATASSTLFHMGIRNAHICGPKAWTKGKAIAGPALTLQFMPKREDLYGEDEYAEPEKQLHRHVLYHTRPGDIVVVDARGDMRSGIFGEMMMTYFKGRGGIGVVIDGCLRDYPNLKRLDLPLWIRGWTPQFHTQTGLMPFAVNVPIALAPKVIQASKEHHEWEEFSRMKLMQGAPLQRYYPLHADALGEYEEWRTARSRDDET